MHLTWLGHASIQITTADLVLYINPVLDPFNRAHYPKADLILLTSADSQHYSIETCRHLLGDEGFIGGPPDASTLFHTMRTLKPGDQLQLPFCTLTVLDGYTYLLELDNKHICYSDDSLPDKTLKPDILILSLGTSLRTRNAATLLPVIKPHRIIPIHWGRTEGTRDDAEQLIATTPSPYSEKIRIIEENKQIDMDELLRT